MRHSRAIKVILVAAVLDVAAGVAFSIAEHISLALGEYWALSTATTVGYGDVTPKTTAGHLIAVISMLTVIPLLTASFSLITSNLSGAHAREEGERIRRHLHFITNNHPDLPPYQEE